MVGAGANRKSSRPSGCRSGLPDRKLVPVPYQTLVRIFEKDGFSLARQEGDHRIFTKAGVLRPLVIPTYPS
jgi:predicted RNA binding protein YcfA (HicA-like mRNA interferase family)